MRKASWPSKIIINKKVFGLANIIENQYIIWPVKISKFAIVNQITAPTIETWYIQMGHLVYRSSLELPKLAHEIKIKSPTPTKIYGRCIKGHLQ